MTTSLALAEFKKIITYGLVGGLNTLVTTGLCLISDYWSVAYPVYTIYSYLAGIAISFTLNRWLTFRRRAATKAGPEIIKFLILNLSLLGLIQGYQYLIIEIFHGPKLVGIGTGMVLYTGLGYLANRLWVFRQQGVKHEAN